MLNINSLYETKKIARLSYQRVLVHNGWGTQLMRQDDATYPKASNSKTTKRVETIKPLDEYVPKLPIILALLGKYDREKWWKMGKLVDHPNDLPPKLYTFWLLTSHIQIFWPPYHKSNKWRFRWLSHVIQGYQTGILHHRSANEKVTTMHLTMSSWCCYCSARPTHCSSYEIGLHSLPSQPWRCHWILNLTAQAMDGHEGRLSRSKFFKQKLYPSG